MASSVLKQHEKQQQPHHIKPPAYLQRAPPQTKLLTERQAEIVLLVCIRIEEVLKERRYSPTDIYM
eukprot:scaffold952_cov409-Prasinococcus_capsulatus_cf.AAC.41